MNVALEQIYDVIRTTYFDSLLEYKRALLLHKRKESDIDKYPNGYARFVYKQINFESSKIIFSERDIVLFFDQLKDAINEADAFIKKTQNVLNYINIKTNESSNSITLELIELVSEEVFYSLLEDDIFDALHQKFGSSALEEENMSQEIKDSSFFEWYVGDITVEQLLQKLKILKG